MSNIFQYLFGESQLESAAVDAEDCLAEILEAAAGVENLTVNKTGIKQALDALQLDAAGLSETSAGPCLVLADNDSYRAACTKLHTDQGLDTLAQHGWVAVFGGDRASTAEQPEFHIRFIEIDTADTESQPETTLNIMKDARAFATAPLDMDDGAVEHNKPAPKASIGKPKDGEIPTVESRNRRKSAWAAR